VILTKNQTGGVAEKNKYFIVEKQVFCIYLAHVWRAQTAAMGSFVEVMVRQNP